MGTQVRGADGRAQRAELEQLQKDLPEEESLAWSFEGEGFSQPAAEGKSRHVRYSEVRNVQVRQWWLPRLFGLGSVQVSCSEPGAPPEWIEIAWIDEPHRLAEWLLKRSEVARAEKSGGTHGE